jgi:uncharacterized protein (DUF302 family)
MESEVSGAGVIRLPSAYGVAETLDRLERLVTEHGLTVFARLDFSADAARNGLKMRAEQLLIFGNPKAGTGLMQADPVAGIDLPLKALAFEDAEGQTWLAYNAPDYVLKRHALAPSFGAILGAPIPLLEAATR